MPRWLESLRSLLHSVCLKHSHGYRRVRGQCHRIAKLKESVVELGGTFGAFSLLALPVAPRLRDFTECVAGGSYRLLFRN